MNFNSNGNAVSSKKTEKRVRWLGTGVALNPLVLDHPQRPTVGDQFKSDGRHTLPHDVWWPLAAFTESASCGCSCCWNDWSPTPESAPWNKAHFCRSRVIPISSERSADQDIAALVNLRSMPFSGQGCPQSQFDGIDLRGSPHRVVGGPSNVEYLNFEKQYKTVVVDRRGVQY